MVESAAMTALFVWALYGSRLWLLSLMTGCRKTGADLGRNADERDRFQLFPGFEVDVCRSLVFEILGLRGRPIEKRLCWFDGALTPESGVGKAMIRESLYARQSCRDLAAIDRVEDNDNAVGLLW